MSILIKGATMPRLCRECACVQASFSGTGYFCAADELLVRDVNLNDVPPDWCPLVEVPDIIQCKDCKYWDTSWQYDAAPDYHYCPLVDGKRDGNFYCAEAERK